jgi:hypothetical protein
MAEQAIARMIALLPLRLLLDKPNLLQPYPAQRTPHDLLPVFLARSVDVKAAAARRFVSNRDRVSQPLKTPHARFTEKTANAFGLSPHVSAVKTEPAEGQVSLLQRAAMVGRARRKATKTRSRPIVVFFH